MKRNKFSLSHYKLFSQGWSYLTPITHYEVLPGDTVQQATSALVRCSPMLAPVMHPTHCKIHHWFVPYRLLWENWESFITGGEDGLDSSTFPTMTFANNGVGVGSLPDYMGLSTETKTADTTVSALPFRAYALIYNEFYRDQDLQTKVAMSTADGHDTTTSADLLKANWDKDYFTTARPWAQKGPEVTVPVVGDGSGIVMKGTGDSTERNVKLNATDETYIDGYAGAAGDRDWETNLYPN